jgi:hypothetical protein
LCTATGSESCTSTGKSASKSNLSALCTCDRSSWYCSVCSPACGWLGLIKLNCHSHQKLMDKAITTRSSGWLCSLHALASDPSEHSVYYLRVNHCEWHVVIRDIQFYLKAQNIKSNKINTNTALQQFSRYGFESIQDNDPRRASDAQVQYFNPLVLPLQKENPILSSRKRSIEWPIQNRNQKVRFCLDTQNCTGKLWDSEQAITMESTTKRFGAAILRERDHH